MHNELEKTINVVPCDLVVIGTPINLGKLIKINKPSIHVTYELREQEPEIFSQMIKQAIGKYQYKPKRYSSN